MTKSTLLFSTALLGLAFSTPSAVLAAQPTNAVQATETETDRINAWFDEKYEEELAFSPIEQTFIGRKTDYGLIDDFSEAGADRQLAWLRDTVAEMKSRFDYAKLSPEAQTSYDIWSYNLKQAEAGLPFRTNRYVLHQHNGLQSFFPTFLINTHKVATESDMLAYIQRLSGVATALDQLLARAQTNAAAGTRPPRFAYEGVIDQSTKIISGAPFDDGEPSAIWTATEEKMQGLVNSGEIDEARAALLREQARVALTSAFAPAYQRIIAWYQADMPNSDAEPKGVGALSNGQAFYDYRLANQTTTELTADEIHNLGLSEVARLRGDMEAVKEQVGFDGDLKAFFKFIREDDRFYFSDDDAGADQYIAAAKGHIDALKALLPDYFGILPKADLEVRRVESFRERDGAAQHYRSGTPDGSRPGIYYAHLSDMRAMPIPTLEVIAYHEGLPGHHMQISIAQELTGIPTFRTQAGYTAYSEGWGLYSETLAKEMGGYADPYSEFGRLTSEIWRAIRLVVDTGLHSKGWSEDQAVAYFLENSSIPEAAVRSEVRRYLVNPGQATSYKIGMIKILELRARAKEQLGDKFDIRAFHDVILGGGALPLGILEQRVDQWITATKEA
ncbi:MAG: DUF885 domain-containing protein [Sphingomonadales bacterium]|nr:DUF885 domain-containing protein [Sphingomonadales bacterium]PIX66651.1 MAG: DUF885 domain-containing protein [Sphingomonadales bacterium CG_4_10_14_3_um_filter_58_15]NCO49785.1 DUF885 domain-containing protein [Sphingomonadales bacterium]NCP01645.1 DUF885 domain-containing protein [Sphingomonadales bacterium]NCP27571.1 DUF885 domain-containing protein [Sphingomonadales bacterium]